MKALESRSLWLVYCTILLAGHLIDSFDFNDALHTWKIHWARLDSISWATWIFMPLMAFFLVVTYRFVQLIFRWKVDFRDFLRQILTPLSYLHAAVLGSTIAILEEWFFRGILQPRIGLILSACIFSLAHVVSHRQLLSWMFWNFLFGLSLGLIVQQTQSFFFSAAIHALFNIAFLIQLNREAYRAAVS